MKLNADKVKTMIVSRSRIMRPQSPPSTVGGTLLKESVDLDILRVIFYSKINFCEASFLGLQSSFPVAWYLEEVLASIS